MSISRHNLSVIIVSFNSDHVIDRCIESIDNTIEIIVVDNSNNIEFKNKIEKKYKNVRCFLSNKNIGMGAGNNLGIKNVNKDFALILNPDFTILSRIEPVFPFLIESGFSIVKVILLIFYNISSQK